VAPNNVKSKKKMVNNVEKNSKKLEKALKFVGFLFFKVLTLRQIFLNDLKTKN
jgi:hypothetical protein